MYSTSELASDTRRLERRCTSDGGHWSNILSHWSLLCVGHGGAETMESPKEALGNATDFTGNADTKRAGRQP